MTKKPMASLPDVSDDELKARLAPLASQVLPGQGRGEAPQSAAPAPAKPPPRAKVVTAEYLMPETLKLEIKMRAAKRGISASRLIMEILREAGFPVTDADMVDHRRLPRKS